MIETSICISKCRLQLLRQAVQELNITESDLLSLLLQKSRKLFGKYAVTGRAVEYQRGSDKGDFAIHHISLAEVDYEFASGRRYLFKISVSFIFALSISRFLDEIIYEWTKKRSQANAERLKYVTNNNYSHFSISHLEVKTAEIWQIPWPR